MKHCVGVDFATKLLYEIKSTDDDVLCQRGGLGNKHPGNHRYLQAKDALQGVHRSTHNANGEKLFQVAYE